MAKKRGRPRKSTALNQTKQPEPVKEQTPEAPVELQETPEIPKPAENEVIGYMTPEPEQPLEDIIEKLEENHLVDGHKEVEEILSDSHDDTEEYPDVEEEEKPERLVESLSYAQMRLYKRTGILPK